MTLQVRINGVDDISDYVVDLDDLPLLIRSLSGEMGHEEVVGSLANTIPSGLKPSEGDLFEFLKDGRVYFRGIVTTMPLFDYSKRRWEFVVTPELPYLLTQYKIKGDILKEFEADALVGNVENGTLDYDLVTDVGHEVVVGDVLKIVVDWTTFTEEHYVKVTSITTNDFYIDPPVGDTQQTLNVTYQKVDKTKFNPLDNNDLPIISLWWAIDRMINKALNGAMGIVYDNSYWNCLGTAGGGQSIYQYAKLDYNMLKYINQQSPGKIDESSMLTFWDFISFIFGKFHINWRISSPAGNYLFYFQNFPGVPSPLSDDILSQKEEIKYIGETDYKITRAYALRTEYGNASAQLKQYESINGGVEVEITGKQEAKVEKYYENTFEIMNSLRIFEGEYSNNTELGSGEIEPSRILKDDIDLITKKYKIITMEEYGIKDIGYKDIEELYIRPNILDKRIIYKFKVEI